MMNLESVYKKLAIKKLLFALVIILIYILGSNIIIPGINIQSIMTMLKKSPNLSFALSMTGLSLDRLSLFSLGLGPWMSALIFWRVLSVTKIFNVQNLTERQSYQIKYLLSMGLGVMQSFSILSQAKMFGGTMNSVTSGKVIFILLAGLAILIWLGNQNTQYGIGGPTIIILVSMVRGWPNRIWSSIYGNWSEDLFFIKLLITLCFLLLLSFLIFRFYQGEQRLPLTHVMLDNQYSNQSYLPIPTNPAGGMPFMYAFSIMLFPQYCLFILKSLNEGNNIINILYIHMQLDHLLGVLFLILFVVLLSYGFSYVNIDYKDIADNLKKSGDYFYDIYPGKNTEKYLFDKVTKMATISAFVNSLLLGIPMIFSIYWREVSVWAYFIPTWLILMILIREINVQFLSLYHRNDYKTLL